MSSLSPLSEGAGIYTSPCPRFCIVPRACWANPCSEFCRCVVFQGLAHRQQQVQTIQQCAGSHRALAFHLPSDQADREPSGLFGEGTLLAHKSPGPPWGIRAAPGGAAQDAAADVAFENHDPALRLEFQQAQRRP